MTNMLETIIPKSDQLNADDLIGRSITVTITGVRRSTAPDQPIDVSYEGDNGKPYRPCKSMRRVMVNVWGSDGSAYVGQSMTLYRDPGVKFGGIQVGGIRISHMTGLDKPVTMALTETKAARKPFTVQPLAMEKPQQTVAEWVASIGAELDIAPDVDAVRAVAARPDVAAVLADDGRPKLRDRLRAMITAAAARTEPPREDDGNSGLASPAEAAIDDLAACETLNDVLAWETNAAVRATLARLSAEDYARVATAIAGRKKAFAEAQT